MRDGVARLIGPRGEPRPCQGPVLRLLPPAAPPRRAPGVIPHAEENMTRNRKVLRDLLEILVANRVRYAVVGGVLTGLYGRNRTTVDVDLLVPGRSMARIAAELSARGYAVATSEDMVRAFDKRGVAVADLVRRDAHPALRAAAAMTEQATLLGQPVRVVRRGAFVALKFHAAISATRLPQDRYIDVADIAGVVARELPPEDEREALAIAATIYPGAEQELRALIDDLRHGRPIKI